MDKWCGLYLHGFLSNSNSEKGQWFLQQVNAQTRAQEEPQKHGLEPPSLNSPIWHGLTTISYPMQKVEQSSDFIEKALKEMLDLKGSKKFLIGSSMGGFYAQYFGQKYKIPYIMINPALNIDEMFAAHTGDYVNTLTQITVQVDEEYIKQLSLLRVDNPNYKIPSLLLIDDGDEVIDIKFCEEQYSSKKLQHNASKTIVYNGGNHRFIHLNEAWQAINEFLKAC